MAISVELVDERNSELYRKFILGSPHALAQHTSTWGEVIESIGADRPVHLLARDEEGAVVGALPAFIYACDLGSLLISVPQAGGYGGVIENDAVRREEIYEALLARFTKEAEERGCALATISTPPFFGDIALYRHFFVPDFERENFFQYIDLNEPPLSNLNSKQRGNVKRNIRKAVEAGLTVTFEDSDRHFDRWYAIHAKRMLEVGGQPLPRKLFEEARRRMSPESLGFMGYVLDGEETIGGGLFIGLNQVLDIFLMSSDSAHQEKQPSTILISEALGRARRAGYRYFNWQSSSSRESGVYSYKKDWGSLEGLHYYLTKITGDISTLQKTPLSVVKTRYQGHYVMPYEAFSPTAG